MSYTPQLRELIKKVEASRAERVKKGPFRRLTMDERDEVLKNFHPDFIESSMRPLPVGANRGERVPHEFADLIEARSRIEGLGFDLENFAYDVDVLVVGGGGAGASAALLAQEQGATVLMVTKLRFGDANTVMAQGGIQAADKEEDSPAKHYLDVMGGGRFENVPELVAALTLDAPAALKWLEDLGAMFDKFPDGTMKSIHGGGTSRKRMHSARDYSGAEIMRTLRDEVRNRAIRVIEFCAAVELLLDEDGKVGGAVLYNMETGEYEIVRAKSVILAVGGSGRLEYQGFPTTNHYGATADGLVMGYRAGAELAFMHTMQYHPTGAAYPPQIIGLLITEKVRGLGAEPVNIDGQQFVYHLETRDVAAAAIICEVKERQKGIATPSGMIGVWLDSPMIDLLHGAGTVAKELPAMVRQFARFGVDIIKEPMLVYPALHYQNGGLLIDENGLTNVQNLYVVGEAAGGIHGGNRLMGNSLLDIVVFGRRAGKHAGSRAKEIKVKKLNLNHVQAFHRELEAAGVDTGGRVSPILLPRYTHRKLEVGG
ncbi:MAG: FAD-binding protein [Dethiobacter sp.]|jgi:succinate dehydrogenase / fumarate reductase flavoprotein subunit|nr:FAD-binding protein [Dethiobacter sp.]MBS3897550.1 FAD-binding protein [Dethiobacter sp.]MBS3982535.1 FAD-binding protein [Dethiobacter sp.]MCL4462299.1 FAD-binding protein [Bacillota bacterium]MCL5992954.1 FAD-binding protein [Bacillota bacterium]